MKENNIPLWEQLPDIDLYLDQVLLYVNQSCSAISTEKDKPLTAAMVNNYVKQGLLSKPIKKKYTRHQIARLIVLQLLKPVFALPDIAQAIEQLRKENQPAALYNAFICYLTDQTTSTHAIIKTAAQTLQLYQETLQLAHQLGEHPHGTDL